MAYTASLDTDTHLSGAGNGNLSLDQRKNTRSGNLHSSVGARHPYPPISHVGLNENDSGSSGVGHSLTSGCFLRIQQCIHVRAHFCSALINLRRIISEDFKSCLDWNCRDLEFSSGSTAGLPAESLSL